MFQYGSYANDCMQPSYPSVDIHAMFVCHCQPRWRRVTPHGVAPHSNLLFQTKQPTTAIQICTAVHTHTQASARIHTHAYVSSHAAFVQRWRRVVVASWRLLLTGSFQFNYPQFSRVFDVSPIGSFIVHSLQFPIARSGVAVAFSS